jgi:hypothetical protein
VVEAVYHANFCYIVQVVDYQKKYTSEQWQKKIIEVKL